MEDNKNIKTGVWTLCGILRTLIGYYDLYGNVVKLLFIKYISTYPDKLLLSESNNLKVDDYKKLVEFKRNLDGARIGKNYLSQSEVSDVLGIVDKFVSYSNVRLSKSIDDMSYFFEESNQVKILSALDAFALEDNPNTMREIFDALIDHSNNDVKMTGENTTSQSLRKLAVSLLEINEKDSLLNGYCGFSTLLLNVEKIAQYAGYDLNANNVQVSLMMAIMLGLEKYSLQNDDFIMVETAQKFTKAFIDGPLGIKKQVQYIDDKFGSLRDIEAIGMYKTTEMLEEGGKAVFAVPGKILFSGTKGMVKLRDYLVFEGLKAVITLPPLWQGAGVPTNLVVLEKGYTGTIAMVDAKDLFEKTTRKSYALSDESLNKIIVMSNGDLLCDECAIVDRFNPKLSETWIPTAYIEKNTSLTLRDIEEIDSELEELYAELRRL